MLLHSYNTFLKEGSAMSCGKDDCKVEKKESDEDLQAREEWEKKNPSCSPAIDKDCPHGHIPTKE
jgi:hypothetical protein